MLYRNWVEPETYQRKDVSPPTKMFIARKIRNKSRWYQISRYLMDSSFQILEIWYPILCCLYLGSLILCRNVFLLQTELQIPPFKWDMSQPSSMFVAGDISPTILGAFFLGHPVGVDPFPDPVSHFAAPWRPFSIFEVLIEGMIESKNFFSESWPKGQIT